MQSSRSLRSLDVADATPQPQALGAEAIVIKKSIFLLARYCGALFLAVLAWVWFRYAGAFWSDGYLDLLQQMTKSVIPLQNALAGFVILLLPALIVSFIVDRNFTTGPRITIYATLGTLYSILCLPFIYNWDFEFVGQRFWVYAASGCLAGFTYGAILEFPWGAQSSSPDGSESILGRRKLLSSLGLLMASAGLAGGLYGPFRLWKNRNNYIDVNVENLQEGELMKVVVDDMPVLILKRSASVIDNLRQESDNLLDPNSELSRQPEAARNSVRSIRSEFFVASALCPHLGCVPTYMPDGQTGISSEPLFFCPCHGGKFDLAGRVYRYTPPKQNIAIPTYEYVSDNVVRIYFRALKEAWNE